MSSSTQHKLDRVRAPRVQITYDVEIGGATQQKELPFVVGVVADLFGNAKNDIEKLKSDRRQFVEIDRDNFDTILGGIQPEMKLKVSNCMGGEAEQLSVNLSFEKLEDFEPQNLAQQVEPLNRLLTTRKRLSDLLSKLDGNDDLLDGLQSVIHNSEQRRTLKQDCQKIK